MDTFRNRNSSGKKITISDIAEALGVSTTTVSRAISGKGRIGADTRERVLAYIDKMDYKPNFLAQGLAKSRTFHIGMLLPENCELADMSFFVNCMQGVCEQAALQNYDIVMISGLEDDISNLERMVDNHKVDGIIVSRSQEKDTAITYLKNQSIPFVLIGSSEEEQVIQVDYDRTAYHAQKQNEMTIEQLARELGMLGCRVLLSYIEGEEVQGRKLLRI